MGYKKAGWTGLLLIAGIYGFGSAGEFKLTTYGEGTLIEGQIFRGVGLQEPKTYYYHRWQQASEIIFGERATKGDRITIDLSLRGTMQYSFYIDPSKDVGAWTTKFPCWGFQINSASGTYIFGDPETKPFSITLGFFPYKYNPEVKNLGEYLFRSMAYPNFLHTIFDEPYQRILGLKLSSLLLDGILRQDLIISNEWDINPTQDFSVAYVAGLNIGKILDIGLGGQAYHLFSVDKRYTQPDRSVPPGKPGTWYITNEADAHDSIYIDSITYPGFPDSSYIPKQSYYTFKGIKLMGRINFNPLANAPEIKIPVIGTLFGKQDLKIYGEVNVLGLKNYSGYKSDVSKFPLDRTLQQYDLAGEYYSRLSERIPVTFGINAPTNPVFAYGIIPIAVFMFGKEEYMFNKQEHHQEIFYDSTTGLLDTATVVTRVGDMSKRLMWSAGSAVTTGIMLFLQDKLGLNVRPDVLNFEFEYWSNRYPNSFEKVFSTYTPVPVSDLLAATAQHNRWHWSVYASKQIEKWFVNFQIAHDHLIPFSPELHKVETSDAVGAAGLWWWTLKTGFRF